MAGIDTTYTMFQKWAKVYTYQVYKGDITLQVKTGKNKRR